MALAQALPASTALGPLGSDGQTYGLLYDDPTTARVLTALTFDPQTMASKSSLAVGQANIPLGGIYWTAPEYVSATFSTQPAGSEQFVTFSSQANLFNAGASSDRGRPTCRSPPTAPTYYMAMTDSAGCEVYMCNTNFLCPNSTKYYNNGSSCTALRIDVESGEAIIPTLAGGLKLSVDFLGLVTASYMIGSTDNPEAFVPLAGSVPHLLWWSNGALLTAAFVDLTSPSPPTPTLLDQRMPDGGAATGETLDAVNDGPNATGYAAVYWGVKQGTGVYFVHECQ